jgi:anti-sigma factor RsiW
METGGIDETLMVKYLLGNLSEDKQIEVEDRALADPEYRGALETAEADLIDAYVRGELSQTERRAFEGRFLTSPQRRNKVEFARALAAVTVETNAAERPAAKHSFMALLRGWTPTMRFAAGLATLICVAGVLWLLVQNAAMRSRVAALENRSHALEGALAQEQGNSQAREAELRKKEPAGRSIAPVIASLVLYAGVSRAETKGEELVLSAETRLTHIEIQLEPRDDYPAFRAELRTRSGAEVLSENNLSRQPGGAGYVVSFDVPASVLKSGQYELALKGIRDKTRSEDVSYSYFSVTRH